VADRRGRTPPHAPAETTGARVDAALAADELDQMLGIRLVRRRVPHNPAPFAPGSFVGFRRVGSAPYDGGEDVLALGDF